MMALPSGVKVTAWQVRLGTTSLSSSFPELACHTLTSLPLLVAKSSEDSLQPSQHPVTCTKRNEGGGGAYNGNETSVTGVLWQALIRVGSKSWNVD